MSALKLFPNSDAAANALMERKKIDEINERRYEESGSQSDIHQSRVESGENP